MDIRDEDDDASDASVLVEIEVEPRGGGESCIRAVGPFATADAARAYADRHAQPRGRGYWLRVPLERPRT